MNTVVISQERYEELIKAELRLNLIFRIATKDNSTYGYSENTAKAIDVVLGIER